MTQEIQKPIQETDSSAESAKPNSYNFLRFFKHKTHFLGVRRSAIVEVGIFFFLACIVEWAIEANRFWGMPIQPYTIIVVLVAAQYGAIEGFFAVLVSALFLFTGVLPEYSIMGDIYQYGFELFFWPMIWLSSAFLIGAIADRHLDKIKSLEEQTEAALRAEKLVSDEYKRIQKRNEKLEIRIASQMRTGLTVARSAVGIETLNTDEIFERVVELIYSITHADKFSIFLRENEELRFVAGRNENFDEETPIAHSFSADSPLYKAVVLEQRLLSAVHEDEQRILGEFGILAVPLIVHDSGHCIGMLKVESISFIDLHVGMIETFRALGEWISGRYSTAQYHEAAVEQSYFNPSYHVHSATFFQRQKRFIISLAKRVGFDVSMIVVHIKNHAELGKDQGRKAAYILGQAVQSELRVVDQMFDYDQKNFSFALILPATAFANVSIVIKKLLAKCEVAFAEANIPAELHFEIHSLFAANSKPTDAHGGG